MCGGSKKKKFEKSIPHPSKKSLSAENSKLAKIRSDSRISSVQCNDIKTTKKSIANVKNLPVIPVKNLSMKKNDEDQSTIVDKSMESMKVESFHSSRYFAPDKKKNDDSNRSALLDETMEDRLDSSMNYDIYYNFEKKSIEQSAKILSKKSCQSIYFRKKCRIDKLTVTDIFGDNNTVYNNEFFKKILNDVEDELGSPECIKAKEIIANFISNNEQLYKKYLAYYFFLVDAIQFFEINYQFLTVLNVPRWNKSEAFRKTTMIIIGNNVEINAKLIGHLLKKESKDILNDITQYPENNISFFKPDVKYNKNGPFGDLEQKFCDIDWVLFQKYRKSHINSTSFSDSIFLEKYNIVHLYDPIDKNNLSLNEINAINDYIIKKTDITTIVIDDKKIDKTFKKRLKKVKPYSNKILFAMDVSNQSVSKTDINIKKEIIRWFVTDKFKKSKPIKIVALNLTNLHLKDVKAVKTLENDMKCLDDWIKYYQFKTLFSRYNEILKCCGVAISYILLLNGILYDVSFQKLINGDVINDEVIKKLKESLSLAASKLNLPFSEEIVGPRIKFIEIIKDDFKLPYLPIAFRYTSKMPYIQSFVPDNLDNKNKITNKSQEKLKQTPIKK